MLNEKMRIDVRCPVCRTHTIQIKKRLSKFNNQEFFVCKECEVVILDKPLVEGGVSKK